jgi:hypothetical protein
MHFIVSWEVKAGDKKMPEMHNAVKDTLLGYSWVRLLNSFYVIDINSEREWTIIQEKLLDVAQRYSGKVNFLMSPIYDFDSDFFVYSMPNEDFYENA